MTKLFAIPTVSGKLCAHFGHCEKFAILETEDNKIVNQKFVDPPEHQPGTYPKFLAEEGVNIIIAGGMGQRALNLFAQNNIEVFMGVNSDEPDQLVANYMTNQLQTGNNQCDSDGHHSGDHQCGSDEHHSH